jgi:hypothetical protein
MILSTYSLQPSWPGLSRPSTPSLPTLDKTWMPGTCPGMSNLRAERANLTNNRALPA